MIISENFKVLVLISLFLKMKYVVRAHTRAIKKDGILIGQRDRGNISKTFNCKEKRRVFYLIFINHIDRTKQAYALPSIR